jgi:tetratricopeptide (TPR) repeat protein
VAENKVGTSMRIYFILFLLPFYAFAETLQAPELTPALTNQHEQAIIDQGIALHEQGKYDEAVMKFKQVLEKSPGNILAMYEMASSYFAAKKYEDSLKTATEGVRYKSRYLGKFYLFIGNSLDELGRTDDAIEAFSDAAKVVTDDALIHFNLGAILVNSGKLAEAQPHLEKAIELNPTHSSSHYALAQAYFGQNKKIPGILATLRFLSLEPDSKRSQKAVANLDENLMDSEMPEDFKLVQKISAINDLLKTELNKSNEGSFIEDHYSYFSFIQKNNLVPVFTYYIHQSVDREAAAWVEEHPKEIQEFRSKTSTYVK